MLSALTTAAIVGYAVYLVKKSDDREEKDHSVEALNDIFKEKKVKNFKDDYAYISGKMQYDTFIEYSVEIPLGKTIEDIEKCLPAIETHFKNNASVEVKNKTVLIKLYTTDLKDHYIFESIPVDKEKGLLIYLGNSRDGVILKNLSDSPHLSVIGETGSGKSVFVNCILCNLIENYTSDELELILFDLKGNELNEYADLKHTTYHTRKVTDTVNYFSNLKKEMERRYDLLGNHRDIKSYNKSHPDNLMKYQFIVIEECISLLSHKKAYDLLGEIMSKGRACGMHFLLTTQRPSADIIPKLAYTHVTTRVGLRTSSSQESRNAIEIPGLEKISDPGRGIMKVNGNYICFKSSFISQTTIDTITNKYKKTPDKKTNNLHSKSTVKKENKSMIFDLEEEL